MKVPNYYFILGLKYRHPETNKLRGIRIQAQHDNLLQRVLVWREVGVGGGVG